MIDPDEILEKDRRLSPLSFAFVSAGIAFVLVLVLLRVYHPLLVSRHPDRALMRCGAAALGAFVFSLFVSRIKRPPA